MRQQPCTLVVPPRSVRAAPLELRYLRHLPVGYGDDPAARWPLILFLHGAGERGDDLRLLLHHGLPRVVEESDDVPCVVLSPQCPERSYWYLHLRALAALLDDALTTLAVDEQRVYLTGLSMGGYGAWHLGARHPERFAAVAPICGGGLRSRGFPARARALREVAVWAFHGAQDEVVRPEQSQRLVDELRACGGRAQLTIYPDAAHDSWTRTYADPAFFRWLLAQRRVTEGDPAVLLSTRARPSSPRPSRRGGARSPRTTPDSPR